MAQRFPSLEVIAAEVHDQLQIQLRHFDGLDTKAGIVLGFSGALVALSGRQEEVLSMAGLVTAGLAALTSVLAFIPRAFPVIDVKDVRETYLTSETQFTLLHLLDTRIAMWQIGADLLRTKALRLMLAQAFLGLATAGFIASILFQ